MTSPSAAGPSFELPLGVPTREMVAPLPISLTNILKSIHDSEH